MPTFVYQQTWDVDLGSPDASHNATQQTTTKHDGAGALKLNCAADVAYWLKNASTQIIVAHIWMRFNTLPSGTVPDLIGGVHATPGFMGLGFDSSGKMYTEIGSQSPTGNGGPTLVANTWYEVDLRVNASGGTATVDGRINGTALPQNTVTGGPFTLSDYRLGEYASAATYDLYFDTFDVSHTAADYPLVYGQTILPDADNVAGGWTTTPLFSKVNDASDATVITATAT